MRKLPIAAVLLLACITVSSGVCAEAPAGVSGETASAASEPWQKEFEDVCSKTQDAMTFSPEELKVLIRRCDAIEPQIRKLDETRKKVYLRRLDQCRGLYAYVLDSKKSDSNKAGK